MNLDDYAESLPVARRGPGCWLCEHPELRKQVVAYLADGGQKKIAADWLREHHGLEKNANGAIHHVYRCVDDHDKFHV